MILTATNPPSVVATVVVGNGPVGVAVTPSGARVYVTNGNGTTVSVISTATNPPSVVATVVVGNGPGGVAVTPDGAHAYVTNQFDNTVSVISTATNMVVGFPVLVGNVPLGVAVTPNGARVYVTNSGAGSPSGSTTVSVINTATNMVSATVALAAGSGPAALGKFIAEKPALWGVDSLTRANTMVGNQTLFDVVSTQAGRAPAFWGRYIGNTGNLNPAEITFLHSHNCRILLIFRDTANVPPPDIVRTRQQGVNHAKKAIAAAQALGVPGGVWIYADLEVQQSPTSEWFQGWFNTMQSSIYGGGVFGNTNPINAAHFNTPYCLAYGSLSPTLKARAYVYANQPQLSTPDQFCNPTYRTFNPDTPPC